MRSIQLCALVMAAFVSGSAAERYENVLVDQAGKVTVVTEDGRHITPPVDDERVGADQAAVAPDHQSVGWRALYPFCCTLTASIWLMRLETSFRPGSSP